MSNKFIEISSRIAKEIDLNISAERAKLPTEKELADQFQVSRETIRKALKHLIEVGRVYSIQGSGYYVRPSNGIRMESMINRYSSVTDMIRSANLIEGDLEIQIFKRRPKEEELTLLKLDKQDWVFIVDRIRTASGEPVVYSQGILPESIVGRDFPERFEPGSLGKYLEHYHSIHIVEAFMEIQAVREEDSLPYRMKQSESPLLKFFQIHYDAKASPIFLSFDYMRNDLIRFYVRRTK